MKSSGVFIHKLVRIIKKSSPNGEDFVGNLKPVDYFTDPMSVNSNSYC